MFSNFLEESIQKQEADVIFFEESIAAKLNRSSTKMTKTLTPFLDDTR